MQNSSKQVWARDKAESHHLLIHSTTVNIGTHYTRQLSTYNMAEIVGFTASIIAIVELVRKATTLSYEYLRGVKRAPKDLGDLVCELGSLGKVLISVQHIADQNTQKLHVLHSLGLNNCPLHGIAAELNMVISKLESASKAGFRGSVERLKWPLQEAETMQHISRIERYKALFIFALSADQM
jgi:hypothetical protein